MESNIIKFTSITEGESSYSIELSMPFIGISVDEEYKPVSALNYECVVSVMKGTTKLLPSGTATAGTYKLQLITTSVTGLKNITANNTTGKVTFSADIQNALSNGEIQFNVLLEDDANVVMKTIGFTALQGLMGSDGLTYSFDYDNGLVYKFKNGETYEYTPKTFRIAAYRRQGMEPREKLTNTECDLTATVSINNTEVDIPIQWDSANQVFFISFEDSTVLTVNGNTDYITQFNIRRLTINIYDNDDVLLDCLKLDVNYGTSDDAASLVLNPTSIIGAIQNTKIRFTTDGLQVYRGGMKIYRGTDNNSDVVFEADENGNLRVRGSITNGSAMAGWAIREHTMISGGGLVGIGDGNAQSPAGDYAFWAGDADPEEAPFSVKKTGEMKATLLEIGGTQITQGTIRTGAFAPGAVDNAAIGEDAIDSVNIRQGAIITDHLYANSVTVDKLAADVGQSLDLSSNESINLMAGDLREAIEYAQENAYGQTLQIVFTDGNAFEYGKSNLEIVAHVWKDGDDITDLIPVGSFRWQRESGNASSDTTWNLNHRATKSITLPRDEIGKSCVIRCICDERGVYPVISHTENGNVYLTIPDNGTTDTFSIGDYCLYVDNDIYDLRDGYLYVNTYTDYLSTESTAFDHSMLLSSHISIKDDKVDIQSGGAINMLAGSDINIGATADINVMANGNIIVANGGHMTVASGGDITISSGGKLKVSASDIQFTANKTLDDALSGIDDDIDDLDERLGRAELKITPSAIVSTVRSDTNYQNDISNAEAQAKSYTNNVIKNYYTKSEAESKITQSANGVLTTVSENYSTIEYAIETAENAFNDSKEYTNNKLTSYSSTTEVSSMIDQKAEDIMLDVSKTYSTKKYAEDYTDDKLVSYSTTEEMNAAINLESSSITQRVSETYSTKTEVQNIAVGGRNLLMDSEKPFTASVDAGSTCYLTQRKETAYGASLTHQDTKSDYTISFDWNTTLESGYFVAEVSYLAITPTTSTREYISPTNKSGRYVRTFKLTQSQASYVLQSVGAAIKGAQTSGTFTWSHVKFEKGNKATDWTAAPEEVDGEIVDLKTRMSEAEQKITPTAITSTVRNSNEYKGDLREIEDNANNALSQSSKAAATANRALSEVNGISVGGRNLLINSKDFKNVYGSYDDYSSTYQGLSVRYKDFSNPSSEYVDLAAWGDIVVEPNADYTLSCYVKGSGTMYSFLGWGHCESGINSDGISTTDSNGWIQHDLTENWERYWITWHMKASDSAFTCYLYPIHLLGSVPSSAYICGVKFEKGNKPTDWSSAPEDMEGRMTTAESIINQTADTIDAVVTEYTDGSGNRVKAVNNVKTSSVTITSNGVAINSTGSLSLTGASLSVKSNGNVTIDSGGKLIVNAGGAIQIATGDSVNSYINLGNGNLCASYDGGLVAGAGKFTSSLQVGGKNVLTADILSYRIVVSKTRPLGSGVIWIDPTPTVSSSSSSTVVSGSKYYTGYAPSSYSSQYVINYGQTVSCSFTSGDSITGSASATVSFSVYKTGGTGAETNKISVQCGGVDFGYQTITLNPGSSTTLSFNGTVNASYSSLNVYIKGSTKSQPSGDKQNIYLIKNSAVNITCTGSSPTPTPTPVYSDACTVRFIPN